MTPESSDADLLREFARDGSQPAFAELVRRHVDLVYAAARRQARSPQLAEEIAQSVFTDLARNAARISDGQPLAAWLHLVTRRTAVDVIRREARRRAREELAATMAMHESPGTDWTAVAPLLDEAVATLSATDRAAIVLRFFQDQSLRQVGAALGLSDDAAQKRVSRALDQLRTTLARRGVVVTAAGLATELSAHAIELAPAGLGGAIATTSVAAIATSGAGAAATHLVAMTLLQKSLMMVALVVAGGATIYQTRVVAQQAAEIDALQSQTNRDLANLDALRRTQADTNGKLKAVEAGIDTRLSAAAAVSPADAALEAQMKEWLGQIDRLKLVLYQHPELNIPELQLLSDQEWFNVASAMKFDSDDAARKATAQLRHRAENIAAGKIFRALQGYVRAHDGMLPNSAMDLAPYADPPIDAAILQRYEMVQSGKASEAAKARSGPTRGIVMAPKAPADVENDAYWWITTSSYGNSGSAMSYDISQAQTRFRAANNGQPATSAMQLSPYLKWGEDLMLVQKRMDEWSRPLTP